MRPSHLHFLVYKPGFKTLISQLYDPEDPNLETDAQFGVTRHLIGKYVKHGAAERTPAGDAGAPWYSLDARFRHGAWRREPAAAADQRQSPRRAAANSASRSGVNSIATAGAKRCASG